MRFAGAHIISFSHLVDNLNEERQKGEYMVSSSLLLLTQAWHRSGEELVDEDVDPRKICRINK
jgi:hypothetical protein